jgi:hypothetical protein
MCFIFAYYQGGLIDNENLDIILLSFYALGLLLSLVKVFFKGPKEKVYTDTNNELEGTSEMQQPSNIDITVNNEIKDQDDLKNSDGFYMKNSTNLEDPLRSVSISKDIKDELVNEARSSDVKYFDKKSTIVPETKSDMKNINLYTVRRYLGK